MLRLRSNRMQRTPHKAVTLFNAGGFHFHRSLCCRHYWSERLPESPASISFRLSACSCRCGCLSLSELYQDV